MFLEELAYQIDGKLNFGTPGHHYVEIVDYFGSPCGAEEWEGNEFVKGENATGWGKTREEARADLVEKIKGKVLRYHYPTHGLSYEGKLRIPPTLVVDKAPEVNETRKVCPHTLETNFPIGAEDFNVHTTCRDEGDCKRIVLPIGGK